MSRAETSTSVHLALDIPACSQSVRHTVGEEHRQLRMDHAPILPPASPFLCNIDNNKILTFESESYCSPLQIPFSVF